MYNCLRKLAVVVAAQVAAGAYAVPPVPQRIDVYQPGRQMGRGEVLGDTLPQAYGNVEAHLRFDCSPHRAFAVSLTYDCVDSSNYHCLTLRRLDSDGGEMLTAQPLELLVSRCTDGRDSLLQVHRISKGLRAGARQFSFKLVSNDYGCTAIVGQNKDIAEISVPFDGTGGSTLAWTTANDLEVLRHSLSYAPAAAPQFGPFDSIVRLDDYLSHSDDPREGYWVYLDRDTRPALLALGGEYTFATVRTDDGYQLLYISGAQSNQDFWQPLQVKGRLFTTGFIDHYDLEWIDAFGRPHRRELNAQLSTDATLVLNFPLHHSKLRFRRLPKTSLTSTK